MPRPQIGLVRDITGTRLDLKDIVEVSVEHNHGPATSYIGVVEGWDEQHGESKRPEVLVYRKGSMELPKWEPVENVKFIDSAPDEG
jgi:hypothetical protein